MKKRILSALLVVVLVVGMTVSVNAGHAFNNYTALSKGIINYTSDIGGNGRFVLKSDGSVWIWGEKSKTSYEVEPPRKLFDGVAEVVNFSSGLFLMKNGDLVMRDYDNDFKTETVLKSVKSVPVENFAIRTDNSLVRFGYVGFSKNATRIKPVVIANGVADFRVSSTHNENLDTGLILKTDGTVLYWGFYDAGGRGTASNPVTLMSNAKAIDMQGSTCFVLQTDGSLWSLGLSGDSLSGAGEATNAPGSTKMVKIMDNVAEINGGGSSMYALRTDGTLYGWGRNTGTGYNIGVGSTKDAIYKPTKVLGNVKAFCGADGLALTNDNALWSWGDSLLGDGKKDSTTKKPVKILDSVHAAVRGLAVKKDGSIWAWGLNNAERHITVENWGNPDTQIYAEICGTGSQEEYVLSPERVIGVSYK